MYPSLWWFYWLERNVSLSFNELFFQFYHGFVSHFVLGTYFYLSSVFPNLTWTFYFLSQISGQCDWCIQVSAKSGHNAIFWSIYHLFSFVRIRAAIFASALGDHSPRYATASTSCIFPLPILFCCLFVKFIFWNVIVDICKLICKHDRYYLHNCEISLSFICLGKTPY